MDGIAISTSPTRPNGLVSESYLFTMERVEEANPLEDESAAIVLFLDRALTITLDPAYLLGHMLLNHIYCKDLIIPAI